MKDKQVEKLIKREEKRQKETIDLIASENFVSQDVSEALGSAFVNKYAEGYPGARYYKGNQVADEIENLCRERALKLFGLKPSAWSVNVQLLSGSPANLAVYSALVPMDGSGRIMGMALSMGGHLTHGQKVSLTGKIWQQISYGVDKKTEMLDYNEITKIAEKEKPHIIVAGFTAYPRKIDFKKFRQIADSVHAYLMVDMSHFAGLVAGGAYPSPFSAKGGQALADVVTTTTHKTLRGPRSAMIFSRRIPVIHNTLLRQEASGGQAKYMLHELIDKAVFPGLQGGPHLNQIAGVAVALGEALNPKFKIYAHQIVKNAKALAEELKKRGWRIVSGGTDSHLILVDTWMDGKGISGRDAADKLEKAGIIVNQNTIPFDTRKPMDPSGIRLGTPAVTTRGMKEVDMVNLAEKIDEILRM